MFDQLARAVARESEPGMTLRVAIEATSVWASFSAEERQQVLHAVNTTVEHEFAGGIDELDALNFDDAEAYGGHDVLFPDGYGRIADYLARDLDIRLGEVVGPRGL